MPIWLHAVVCLYNLCTQPIAPMGHTYRLYVYEVPHQRTEAPKPAAYGLTAVTYQKVTQTIHRPIACPDNFPRLTPKQRFPTFFDLLPKIAPQTLLGRFPQSRTNNSIFTEMPIISVARPIKRYTFQLCNH